MFTVFVYVLYVSYISINRNRCQKDFVLLTVTSPVTSVHQLAALEIASRSDARMFYTGHVLLRPL